jgi:N-acetylglucosamine-6-phosphate deacetylase
MLYIGPTTLATDGRLVAGGAVLVSGAQIVAAGPSSSLPCPPEAARIHAEGLLLAPGFIDLQINGGFGHDFTANPCSIWEVASLLPQYGVTSFLPTIITSPQAAIPAAQSTLMGGPPPGFRGAAPLGLHLEGPFLSPSRPGAHDPSYLRVPSLDEARQWSRAAGVRMVTLAPELPGALPVARALKSQGVVVSVGHTEASWREARAGLDAGISYGTHLFNAMPPLHHREPGVVGALLTDGRAVVGVITDGIHLHPAAVNLIWRTRGSGGVSLVTDAMAGLGMPPGTYRLGAGEVYVSDGSARLAGGTLAGSVLSLDGAVRNLVSFTGCPPAQALDTVTGVPASLLGLDTALGRIAAGCRADLVLLTRELEPVATMVGGEWVWGSQEIAQPMSHANRLD